MITITINGLEIGNKATLLRTPVKGLTIPNIRTASGVFSGTDGGWVSAQFYGMREMTIEGTLNGRSCAGLEALWCEIQEALPIRQSLPFVLTSPSGEKFYTEVYVLNLEMDLDSTRFADFQISLVAPDPYFYKLSSGDDSSGGWVEEGIYKIIGGGYITPYILPVLWNPGSSPTVITNPTSILIYPQIVLEGDFTNPRITNNTTGLFIQINGNFTGSDRLVIDMYNKTVTLNGGSILTSKEAGSFFYALQPGSNSISLTTSSGGDDGSAIIRYRVPYTGVFSC